MDVLFEDEHLLVVNKPAELPTMGTPPGRDTLLNQVRHYLGRKRGDEEPAAEVYTGFIGRLDAPVTGISLVACEPSIAGSLTEQFRAGTAYRTYWALVEHAPVPPAGTLSHWLLSRLRPRRVDVVNPAAEGAKLARLNYRVLQTMGRSTLVEIELLTGRKHQIRAQLGAHHSPIHGDRKYGSKYVFPINCGIALHALLVNFVHPISLQSLQIRAPLPHVWRNYFPEGHELEWSV